MTIQSGTRRDTWKVITSVASAALETTLQTWTDEGYTFYFAGWNGASYDLMFKRIEAKP